MTDQSTAGDRDAVTVRPYPGTPGWVKVLGITTLILVVIVGVLQLTGEHGPGHHIPASTNVAPATQQTGH